MNTSKTNTNSSKQEAALVEKEKEKQRKFFDIQDLRTSVKDDRYYRMIGSPKIASERVSVEKEHRTNNNSKPKNKK